MRKTPLALAGLLALGCSNPPVGGPGDDAPRFQVGVLELHATSGAVVETAFGRAFYVTDQPDACDAVSAVPQAIWTILSVWVAPGPGGETRATVAAGNPPTPGHAAVGLARLNRDTATTVYDGADGSIAWTEAADGTVTLTSIDVGFTGVSGRIAAEGLVLAPCEP